MEDLQNTIKEGEKKHRTHLFLFRWGEKIQHSGELAWPLLDKEDKPIRTVWSCFWRFCFIGMLFALFKLIDMWWMCLVVYAVFHLALFFIGRAMVKKNGEILDELDKEFDKLWYDYLRQKAEENSVTIEYPQDYCQYEDGIKVFSGRVFVPMERDYGEIRIYRNNEYRDTESKERYTQYRSNLVWFKEQIASVEFRERFQVCTNVENQMLCMTYLSPTVQLAMTKDRSIDNFRDITISNGYLTAETDFVVDRPANVDMYKFRPIGWYFKDIDKYVVELKKLCDQAHAYLVLLKAMRGTKL